MQATYTDRSLVSIKFSGKKKRLQHETSCRYWLKAFDLTEPHHLFARDRGVHDRDGNSDVQEGGPVARRFRQRCNTKRVTGAA